MVNGVNEMAINVDHPPTEPDHFWQDYTMQDDEIIPSDPDLFIVGGFISESLLTQVESDSRYVIFFAEEVTTADQAIAILGIAGDDDDQETP